jgi:hypothetical protein
MSRTSRGKTGCVAEWDEPCQIWFYSLREPFKPFALNLLHINDFDLTGIGDKWFLIDDFRNKRMAV